jgi:hypothetical protein
VRDLRTLRDAAVVLDTYKHPEVCARVLTAAAAAVGAGVASLGVASLAPAVRAWTARRPARSPVMTIAKSTELKKSANKQAVRDLRTLRDAAVVLDTYKLDLAITSSSRRPTMSQVALGAAAAAVGAGVASLGTRRSAPGS